MPVTLKRKKKATALETPKKKAGRPPTWHTVAGALGPERLAMVEGMLLNGDSPEKVASVIKVDWKLLPKLQMAGTIKMLRRYFNDVLMGKIHALVVQPPGKSSGISKFAEDVNVLDNLTKLVVQQTERLSLGIEAEAAMRAVATEHGKLYPLNPKLRFEFATLSDMLAKLGNHQMDLGLIRRVPQKFQLEGSAGMAQKALEQAMEKDSRIDTALGKAFAILDGKFTKVVGDAAATKH